jgi:hypothetical protein
MRLRLRLRLCLAQSWCKNSKTLFHCSTRNTSALVLFHLLNSLSRQLVHTLSDVTHTDATLTRLHLQLTADADDAKRKAQERVADSTRAKGYLRAIGRLYTITIHIIQQAASSTTSHRMTQAGAAEECGHGEAVPRSAAGRAGCSV